MSARKIVLESCAECPYRDHRGGFGSPAYVPVCRKIDRNLPHTLAPNRRGTGCSAVPTNVIPEWCPLPTN